MKMIDTHSHATNKIGIATGKIYRGITIYCQDENLYMIYGANEQQYPFTSWSEATAFVDAWYLMQRAVAMNEGAD